jgi:hypothetical protein
MKRNVHKYVLAYLDGESENTRTFKAESSFEAGEFAKKWLKQHFPKALQLGTWSVDRLD